MTRTKSSFSTRAFSSFTLIALLLGVVGCQRSQNEVAFPTNEPEPIAQAAAVAVSPAPSPSPAAVPQVTWTQQENDYLFDLSQALQQAERERITPQEQVAIGRHIQSWLKAGAGYWQIRDQFDAVYQGAVAGDYVANREAYIRYATARFAARYSQTLTPPPAVKPAVSASVASASSTSAPSGGRYTCAEIGNWDEAQRLLNEGHAYLDRDRDGEACEALR
jgi:hypothetical protein